MTNVFKNLFPFLEEEISLRHILISQGFFTRTFPYVRSLIEHFNMPHRFTVGASTPCNIPGLAVQGAMLPIWYPRQNVWAQ